MRLLFALIFLFSCLPGIAQRNDVAKILRESKGNLKLSSRFKETPVLAVDDKDDEIYRVTIVPTFYNPIKVRVTKHKGRYFLVAKCLDGQGGYDPGKLKIQKRRKLKNNEWKQLITFLNDAHFWEMPFEGKEPIANEKGEITICLDGSEWMLEGVKNGNFHAVIRYCPDEKDFVALGRYLAKISGLRIRLRDL